MRDNKIRSRSIFVFVFAIVWWHFNHIWSVSVSQITLNTNCSIVSFINELYLFVQNSTFYQIYFRLWEMMMMTVNTFEVTESAWCLVQTNSEYSMRESDCILPLKCSHSLLREKTVSKYKSTLILLNDDLSLSTQKRFIQRRFLYSKSLISSERFVSSIYKTFHCDTLPIFHSCWFEWGDIHIQGMSALGNDHLIHSNLNITRLCEEEYNSPVINSINVNDELYLEKSASNGMFIEISKLQVIEMSKIN